MARGTLGLLALLAVVLAATLAGCSDDVDQAGTATAAGDSPGVDAAKPARPAKRDRGLDLDTPPGAYPLIWVRVHQQVRLRSQPGDGELVDRVGRRTQFGSTSAFGVVRQSGQWAGVTTPVLPNGQLAWIRLRDERLRTGWTKTSVVVDLSDRRAALVQEGHPKRTFAVTVGMPGSETPTGRFSVTDTFRGDLNPAYGCCAVALSATQPHLPSGWLGGQRIAIHGTSGPLGIAASHGCVRAPDAEVSELVDHVPLGAPVFIRA
jgi:lipoprotein-anchoring transpeptidase ErfK/SrfK